MSSASTTFWPHDRKHSLEVHSLGAVDFPSLLALQERLVYEIGGRSDRLGALLLCEHPPVVSVGREGGYAQFCVEPEEFASMLMDVHWLPRGGGNVVHAPGQLAVYLILPLDRLGLSPVEYRGIVESAVIDMAGEFRISATAESAQAGIVARTGQFASVGLCVKSWVSHYGVYINVNPRMELIRLTRPASDSVRQTSLAAERVRHTPMNAVRESLVRHLSRRLGYETQHWYTGHPLLTRTRKKVYVHS